MSLLSRLIGFPLAALCGVLFAGPAVSTVSTSPSDIRSATVRLPLRFEPRGTPSTAASGFAVRGLNYSIGLDPHAITLTLPPRAGSAQPPVTLTWQRANRHAALRPERRLPGVSHHFHGNNPAAWRTGVAHYAAVRQHGIYPGIDVVYYGRAGELEYDWVIAPGADPRRIGMRFDGLSARPVLDRRGNLVLPTAAGPLTLRRPEIYQDIGGRRVAISGHYVVHPQGHVGIDVARYDTTRPLTIDPILRFATVIGGSGTDDLADVAVDPSGNIYLIGETRTSDFPAPAPSGDVILSPGDVVVTKLNPAGDTVLYTTYLGGSGVDNGFSIAVDASGNAYAAGRTPSFNFPVTQNALQGQLAGPPSTPGAATGSADAFITKLSSDGMLVYSTFLGGTTTDEARAIAVDAQGQAYVTGEARSPNFPVTSNAFQSQRGAVGDAFAAKLNATGSALVYATYFGGSGVATCPLSNSIDDVGYGIAVNTQGHATLVGRTRTQNLPVLNALQATNGGCNDGFYATFDAAGALLSASYLGGSDADEIRALALDDDGNLYLTGRTLSPDFPRANAAQNTLAGGFDAFVTKINTSNALAYSTYFGGSGGEFGADIAVDSDGKAVIAGETTSTRADGFPIQSPLQADLSGATDAYIARLDAQGQVSYASHFGGMGNDQARSVALRGNTTALVTGATASANFPATTEILAPTPGFSDDGFVLAIEDDPAPSPLLPTLAVADVRVMEGNTDPVDALFTITLSAASALPVSVSYATANFTAAAGQDYEAANGTVTIPAGSTTAQLNVRTLGDTTDEPDEVFLLNLSNPVNAALADAQAQGIITDNDLTPRPSRRSGSSCTAHGGAAPDPGFMLMIFAALIYRLRRRTAR